MLKRVLNKIQNREISEQDSGNVIYWNWV